MIIDSAQCKLKSLIQSVMKCEGQTLCSKSQSAATALQLSQAAVCAHMCVGALGAGGLTGVKGPHMRVRGVICRLCNMYV